jgi:epoxide hydrolase-like predicted phosphatase
VESCKEGLKKPEQAIFDLTLSKLGVEAHEAVFLDDLGRNLKTARLMGMTTIKVCSSVALLMELYVC